MIVYLIRHGQTEWNKLRKMQGRTDIPLNEYGRELAEKTRKGLGDIIFDVAFTSPLKRARETAEILMQGQTEHIVDDARLMEIGFGEFEGSAYRKGEPGFEDTELGHFFLQPELYKPTCGGEPIPELLNRVREFWAELINNPRYQESTVLISTHGAALSGLLNVIKGEPIAQFWGKSLHKNCGISILEVKDGEVKILKEAIVLYKEK